MNAMNIFRFIRSSERWRPNHDLNQQKKKTFFAKTQRKGKKENKSVWLGGFYASIVLCWNNIGGGQTMIWMNAMDELDFFNTH